MKEDKLGDLSMQLSVDVINLAKELYPNLAYGLYLFETDKNYIKNSMPIYFAASIISSVPIIILYASTQKLLLTNMTAGGLKG